MEAAPVEVNDAASLLLTSPLPVPEPVVQSPSPDVDLAAAALEATSNIAAPVRTTTPEQDAQQGRGGSTEVRSCLKTKYREALSVSTNRSVCWPTMKKVILVLNARGTYYYMEDYPKCVDAYYHDDDSSRASPRSNPTTWVAYAEMERYDDAIKCFEQGESRGLTPDEAAPVKEQTDDVNPPKGKGEASSQGR